MRQNRSPSPRPLAAALALSLALVSPAPSRADAVASYQRGLDAVKAGDWAAVARSMEEAIAEMPRASRRIQLDATRFEPYVPHYFLGVARFQLRDCEGALRAWEISTSQGVIQDNRSEYSTLQELRGACEERVAGSGVSAVEVLDGEEERPAAPKAAPPAPQPVPPKPRPVPAPVVAAPEPAPVPPGPEPAGPPEALRTAARAYFDGDYGAVLEVLSGQELEDERAAAQALLFRAAARYALYLLGGEEEAALAEAAREDVAFCRRLAPGLSPDPAAFSPRFVAFFEEE